MHGDRRHCATRQAFWRWACLFVVVILYDFDQIPVAFAQAWNNIGPPDTYARVLKIDPQTPSTLYAGLVYDYGHQLGGVYKSMDGGRTWSPASNGLPAYHQTFALEIDPVTPSTLYVGLSAGGFGSSVPPKLFKSVDGGATWNPITTGLPSEIGVHALAINPQTPSTLYAGMESGTVYKSVDSGATWTQSSSGIVASLVNVLKIDPNTPATVYAASCCNGIYKSVDSGATWSAINVGIPANSDIGAIAINHATPSLLYAATEAIGGSDTGRVFVSNNSGTTWSEISNGLELQYIGIHDLAIDPVTPTTIYAATYGKGVWRTVNGGANWSAFNDGLTDMFIHSVAINPLTPQNPYVGDCNVGAFIFGQSPSITSLSPNSAVSSGSGFVLAVNGTNFLSGATVQWGTTALTTTFVNTTQLTANVPASLIANTGTVNVTVTTAAGTSASTTFTISGAAGVPAAPTNVTGTSGNGQATVSWTAPANNGGTAISGYQAIEVFTVSQNGVVVSEAGVPVSPPTHNARIFIDYRREVPAGIGSLSINTGMAIANPGTAYASITFSLRDLEGRALANGTTTLAPGAHIAKFISEFESVAADFALPSSFGTSNGFGSLEIASTQAISITALRLTTNQRGETLLTTIAVADEDAPSVSNSLYFPQLADGGGFTTTLVLLNTSAAPQSGTISAFDNAGQPLAVRLTSGVVGSTFSYSITSGGAYMLQTDGSDPNIHTGWIQVSPNSGSLSPVGTGIFSYSPNGILITESGVPAATPTSRARIYMDTSGGRDTGVAIVNTSGLPSAITMQAFQADGTTAFRGPVQLSLPSKGHAAKFVDEIFDSLPKGIVGVVEISSESDFAALTLRSLTNGRGDFLMTTFPVADSNQPAPAPIVFPQIADGAGFAKQFILISPSGGVSITLDLLGEDGTPLNLNTQ